jgi:hypothetical protein
LSSLFHLLLSTLGIGPSAAVMNDTRTEVLFVPYRGAKDKKSAGEISQQKHAAREYHRKAKLKRQAQKSKTSPDAIRSKNTSSESLALSSRADSSLSSTSRSVSPATNISASPERRNPSPVSVLGAGRVDPFDSQPVKDLTPCVHEMVDYGKHPAA